MGAFQGSLTYRQYYINEPLPAGWKDKFQAGIEANAFKEIDPNSDVERVIGWCSPYFALDTELTPEMYLQNEYITLALRVDSLKVPGPLLKIQTEVHARRVMLEQKRDSLSRYERAELKEQVKLELRKKLMASIKTIDMVWNWQEGVVRFHSQNEKINLDFIELFEQTFGLHLVLDCAYTTALYSGMVLTEEELQALETVEPCPFVDDETAFSAMKDE